MRHEISHFVQLAGGLIITKCGNSQREINIQTDIFGFRQVFDVRGYTATAKMKFRGWTNHHILGGRALFTDRISKTSQFILHLPQAHLDH